MFYVIRRTKQFSITIGEIIDATAKCDWDRDIVSCKADKSIAKARGKALMGTSSNLSKQVFTQVLGKRLPAPSSARKFSTNIGILKVR